MAAAQPRWIVGVCSVLFDVDIGQKVEHIYPPNALSTEEQTDVAFCSFPDSLSMELHSVNRIKDRYVFCRQRQDERLRRGAEQKAVVVLSEHAYSSVLRPLSQHVGPLFFNEGVGALQQVYEEVMEWPPPLYGLRGVVSARGLSLSCALPPPATLPPPCESDVLDVDGVVPGVQHVAGETMMGPFYEVDVYTPLRNVIKQVWALWELMMLAQPLLVVGPSPGDCSTAVAALLSLITPLPYSADFRPYFTIHDPSFAPMAAGTMPGADNGLPRLLGITNLYFLKALPQWTNVLSVGAQPQRSFSNSNLSTTIPPTPGAPTPTDTPHRIHRVSSTKSTTSTSSGSGGGRAHATGPLSLLSARTESLWTSYKPSTRPNARVLVFLTDTSACAGTGRGAQINSTLLRKHFSTLTTAFLAPFAAFVTPAASEKLTPRGRGGAAAAAAAEHTAAQLPPFSRSEFLTSLKTYEFAEVLRSSFASTASLLNFYKRFLEGPNFSSWFERRRSAVLQWQQATWQLHRQLKLMSVNDHMDEVQMIELFYSLEQTLEERTTAHKAQGTAQTLKMLQTTKKEISTLFQAMPRDLQQTLLSAPHRASLIQNLNLDASKVPGAPRRSFSSGPPLVSGS